MSWEKDVDKMDEDSLSEVNKSITKHVDAISEVGLTLRFGQSDSEKIDKIKDIKNKFDGKPAEIKIKPKRIVRFSQDLNKSDDEDYD